MLHDCFVVSLVYCLPVADEENQKILALLVVCAFPSELKERFCFESRFCHVLNFFDWQIEENETVEINKITPLKHKVSVPLLMN